MTPRARLVGTALAVVLTAGCGSGASGGDASTEALQEREWRVAGDPDATAAEVVDAGVPRDVAVSGERRVVTWEARPDDGEGPHQGAWRLYDASGEALGDGGFGIVSEQGASIGVVAVPDGFVLESYTTPALHHLGPDGTLEAVRRSRVPRATAPGDVLVRVPGGRPDLVYRPSDRTASPLPPLPTDNPQSVVVDGTGAVSVLLPWGRRGGATVATSRDGRAPWSTERLPLRRGDYPVIDLRVADGLLLLLTARIEAGTVEGQVAQLWSRPAGPSGRWVATAYDGDVLRDLDGAVPDSVDGRFVVTSYGKGAWIDGPSGFEPVDLPAAEASVLVDGSTLHALDDRGHRLWSSDDLGASWQELQR